MIWRDILRDAVHGELQPVYGAARTWQDRLEPVVVNPPSRRQLRSYVTPLLGLYPARGCPFNCTFCSVVKIAGHKVRSQPIESTLESIRRAAVAGVRWIMFTSDNFNKYPEAEDLLQAIIDERLRVKLFVQCDTQVDHFSDRSARALLSACYREFYDTRKLTSYLLDAARSGRMTAAGSAAMWGFNRYCAWQGMHPMSGGIGRVRLDRVTDYAPLRRERFDIDLAPLPQNRRPEADNRDAVRVVRLGEHAIP